MKESFWGYLVTIFGVVSIAIVYLFQTITNLNEHNYTLLKETTEAAMIDALDLATYRQTGIVRIDQEKFVENFVRRFANNVQLAKEYKIEIFDVHEEPPKVSIKVSSSVDTNITNKLLTFDIQNKLDAILEEPHNRPYQTGSKPTESIPSDTPSRLEGDDISDILDTTSPTYIEAKPCTMNVPSTVNLKLNSSKTFTVSGENYGTLSCSSNSTVRCEKVGDNQFKITALKDSPSSISISGTGGVFDGARYKCSNATVNVKVVRYECLDGGRLDEDTGTCITNSILQCSSYSQVCTSYITVPPDDSATLAYAVCQAGNTMCAVLDKFNWAKNCHTDCGAKPQSTTACGGYDYKCTSYTTGCYYGWTLNSNGQCTKKASS